MIEPKKICAPSAALRTDSVVSNCFFQGLSRVCKVEGYISTGPVFRNVHIEGMRRVDFPGLR